MSFPSPQEPTLPRIKVGYALSLKKISTFITPSLLSYAADHGVDLIAIDPNLPLSSQGPFNCILHKLNSPNWTSQLLNFLSTNPNFPITDPPHLIAPLSNRITMLEAVNQITLPNSPQSLTLVAPKQAIVETCEKIESLGLEFPLIAKSLAAVGSPDSHDMSLVYSGEGLRGIKAPIVLQEFVNHGGVFFKVYVAGRYVECVKKRSLSDVSDDELQGWKSFAQISNLWNKDEECLDEVAELPPMEFLMDVATGLREALGLGLFNFDMIRDSRDGNRYLIVDINYFPRYATVPGFEKMMTDFFRDIANGKEEEDK